MALAAFCDSFSEGLNHFYWLDNVSGRGTQWTKVTSSQSNHGGQINASVVGMTGRTILSAPLIAEPGCRQSTLEACFWLRVQLPELAKVSRPMDNLMDPFMAISR